MLKQIEVVAAVIQHGQSILATQRGYGQWKGWWEFPGGKLQPGESHAQALIRELHEEMDTDIVIDRSTSPTVTTPSLSTSMPDGSLPTLFKQSNGFPPTRTSSQN